MRGLLIYVSKQIKNYVSISSTTSLKSASAISKYSKVYFILHVFIVSIYMGIMLQSISQDS